MNKSKTTTNNGKPVSTSGGNTIAPPIEIERLAEKVYQLMQADIRQTCARGGKIRKGSGIW